MLKKIVDRYWKTLPKSPTSMTINWIATFIFIYSLTIIKNYDIPVMEAAVFSLIALALPIIILEYIFLKTYNRPSTGLNFKLKNATNISRITVEIVGLYGTIGFVALIYWLFPIYRSGFYDNYWIFIKYIALILLVGGIPYFIILDKYLVEPRDSYWHFGMIILGQWKKSDIKIVKQHILGWLVKLFFLPLMFSFLMNNINFIKTSDFSEAMNFFPSLFDHLQNLIFTVDLAFVSVGYLMTMKIFDSHIRTAEPTILGWIVALQCYQPFWDFSSSNYLHYDNGFYWGNLFVYPEFLYYFWGVSILILLFIYVWASITFGIRFSNLTNRGILTNGPYRFCMHPAYVSKNLSWWLISVPFISQASPWEAVRQSILLLCLNIIYTIRAITEERHLSQDPNYVKYGLAMNKLSIFRGLFGIFPFLKYNPQKYLSQLEDYSGFTIPKSVPLQETITQ
ncbi:MAG: isoprenylcysteine carboxyl methyltransferase [Bacteroidota bacterium]